MSRTNIIKISALSRLIVFVLQLIFNLLPDHKADAFNLVSTQSNRATDFIIRSSLDGFQKWDAKYFVYISEHRYTADNMFAFFPLLPSIGNIFGNFFYGITGLSMQTSCLLACFIANFIFFLGATVSLFDLTQRIFCCEQFSFLVSLIFCFNPSSIFFSSCYTESVFSFAVFTGLLYLHDQQFLISALWFMLASASRSNGIINVAFILYFYLYNIIEKPNTLNCFGIFQVIICCFLIILPFSLFSAYGYYLFCIFQNDTYQEQWCYKTLPIIYDHVQKKYWKLGLFKYYTLRKIPNFVLAFPVVGITFCSVYKYLKTRSIEIKYLGLPFQKLVTKKIQPKPLLYLNFNLFCYFVHLSFLVLFALLFMHVEVTTRMVMSSSPLIYWIIASYIYNDTRNIKPNCTIKFHWRSLSFYSKCLVVYCVSYFLIGILLHVNFLPWT